MRNLWRLLFRHTSVAQLVGFVFANFLGMVILLVGVQFYSDSNSLLSSDENFFKPEFIVISKTIDASDFNSSDKSKFTEAEIADLAAQPFVKNIGNFTPAVFKINGRIDMVGISTFLFFESVPDNYVDIDLTNWKFDETSDLIPIVIPRNYLNLYNFGFAQSQGMPKLTEELITRFSMTVEAMGNGRYEEFTGQVIGFSDRLNTILVPESFIQWANKEFGGIETVAPSRLIIEVANPADKAIPAYLKTNNLQAENGKDDTGKIAYFMTLIVSIVVVIGLLISALSLYILVLSIFLLLTKNSKEIENVLLLGYSTKRVALPYQVLSVAISFVVLVLALLSVTLLRGLYLGVLEELSASTPTSSIALTAIVGIGVFVLTTIINTRIIRAKVFTMWKNKRTKKRA